MDNAEKRTELAHPERIEMGRILGYLREIPRCLDIAGYSRMCNMKKFLTLCLIVLVSLALSAPTFAKGSKGSSDKAYSSGKSYSGKSSKSSSVGRSTSSNSREVAVKSYTQKDGTRVESHKRTAPNKTQRDNWSTKGNTNPYTGKKGTKEAKR